ncbi:MAG: hypothetical protein PF483_12205 [Halothiobacillus sp.]|nr:hypothetical protein [Halothiobacillus sp.]
MTPPSNTSKAKRGAHSVYQHQTKKMEKAAAQMLAQYRDMDSLPPRPKPRSGFNTPVDDLSVMTGSGGSAPRLG